MGYLMGVPKFEKFFKPTLEYFEDNEIHTKKEISEFNAEYFNLTEEERNETTGKGTLCRYKDRTGWAVNYLFNAGLIERRKRGKYIISEEGIKVLNENSDITINFLEKYESFRKYKHGKLNDSNGEVNNDDELTGDNISPTEQLERAYNTINDELSNSLLNEIMNNSPEFFERLVVDLLIKMGYGGSRQEAGLAVGKIGDGGIDGIIKEDQLGLDNIYIQAKRYKEGLNIDGPTMRDFIGALDTKNSTKGVFITTSDFTKNAKYHVEKSSKHIAIVNGKKLTELMIQHNVGVSTRESYEIKEIDSDYFEN